MEEKKVYKLYCEVWNPTLAQGEGEYESKEIASFDSKDSAIRSIKRRKVTSDHLAYYIVEGYINRYGLFENERKIAYRDEGGFTDEVEEYNWW